ncbi:cobalamin biosynthesis protein [Ferrimonas futtsuensis]|uniref:cobalamin biosynthesis protein n=1 Tax=Ferrimonas futtsuensis TaxID=364764 RepID=UPI0004231D32|nr:cobalamin biosynthesis protein [Ferrimonas futtsuensis]
MTRIAIHAITRKGAELGQKLTAQLPGARLFVLDRQGDWGGEQALNLPLAEHLQQQFGSYDQHLFLFSAGIATRMLAPLLQDKRQDPGVVCIDENAHFAIPLLGGHRGGANQMAIRVATLLGATATLTTASDSSGLISVDTLGEPFGWQLDPACEGDLTQVASAVVNHRPTLIWQQGGEKGWWQGQERMPEHLKVSESAELPPVGAMDAAVVISRSRTLPKLTLPAAIWRPRDLVLGIGCDRNTPQQVIEQGIEAFLHANNLHPQSVARFASIDLKADEVGILAMAKHVERPFECFSADALRDVKGIENPSDTVLRCIGVSSVAEAACLHSSGSDKLLVPKFKYRGQGYNLTLAACVIPFEEPLVRRTLKNFFSGPSRTRASHKGLASGGAPKPVRHYRHHLVVCEGGRCQQSGAEGLAHQLRQILKEMNLSKGQNRIKVTRSHCAGACRQRATAVIYARGADVNHSQWLQSLEGFSKEQWQRVFQALSKGQALAEVVPAQCLATMEPCP